MSAWRSREFGTGNSARHIIAETMARRDRHEDVPPAIWAEAGAIVAALRADGFNLRRKAESRPTPDA